jgi:hypothetical protein
MPTPSSVGNGTSRLAHVVQGEIVMPAPVRPERGFTGRMFRVPVFSAEGHAGPRAAEAKRVASFVSLASRGPRTCSPKGRGAKRLAQEVQREVFMPVPFHSLPSRQVR